VIPPGKTSISVQDVSRSNHRQANDAASSGLVTDDVTLGGLLTLGWLRGADV